jgi:hypothetical protein
MAFNARREKSKTKIGGASSSGAFDVRDGSLPYLGYAQID